jgi:23S rRNA (adenine-N6)-dimethyltransferase
MTKKKHKYSNKKLSRGEPPNFSGQHFMHNKRLLREIVEQAKICSADTVLELGAGKGALTTVLSERAGKVLAVEYDEKLVHVLKQKTMCFPNTKIIHDDILNIRLPKGAFVVVSNIPYAITTPIMKMLLNHPSIGIQRAVIVMEKGAAKRFTSAVMKNAYVLAWRMWFDIRYVRDIARHHFSPPPRVDSALVKISRKSKPLVPLKYHNAFWGLAEYALRMPEESVDIALQGVFTAPQLKRLKRNLLADPHTPVSQLAETDWAMIFETMLQHVKPQLWPKMKKK